jgi:hypothetical protein
MSRHLGRFRMNDGRTTGRVGDVAEKMELARFRGHQVIAERDGEDLVIYQIGDPDGLGVNVTNTTDRAPQPQTTADLQKLYDKTFSSGRKTHEQQSDRHSASEALADLARR